MYNDLEVGSYLTWEGWPRFPVFQDPRINGYPEAMHAVLRRADLTRAEWQAFLDGFGVTTALISYPTVNPRSALFAPDRWALVYRADDGLVFVRRDLGREDLAALIAASEEPVTFVRETDGTIAPRVLDGRPAGWALPECEWQRRRGDAFVAARRRRRRAAALRAGRRRSRVRRRARVSRAWRSAIWSCGRARRRPPSLRTRASTSPRCAASAASPLLANGRASEALEELEAARHARPDDADVLLGEGLALAAVSRRDDARAALEAFVRAHPDHAWRSPGARRAGPTPVRLARAASDSGRPASSHAVDIIRGPRWRAVCWPTADMRGLSHVLRCSLLVGLACRPVLAADAPGVPAPYDARRRRPRRIRPRLTRPRRRRRRSSRRPRRRPTTARRLVRVQPPPSEVQPLVATARPSEPSEGGRIAAESLLGFLAVTTSLVVGVQTTPWLILAGPLVTGAIVCGIGSTSSSYTGSCGAAIGGAYLGSLLTIPLAYLLSAGGGSSDEDLDRAHRGRLARLRRRHDGRRRRRLELEPDARETTSSPTPAGSTPSRRRAAPPWREPLLPRGAALEAGAPRVTTPVLAFRF